MCSLRKQMMIFCGSSGGFSDSCDHRFISHSEMNAHLSAVNQAKPLHWIFKKRLAISENNMIASATSQIVSHLRASDNFQMYLHSSLPLPEEQKQNTSPSTQFYAIDLQKMSRSSFLSDLQTQISEYENESNFQTNQTDDKVFQIDTVSQVMSIQDI